MAVITFNSFCEEIKEAADEQQLHEISSKLAKSYASKVIKSGEHNTDVKRDEGLYRATKRIAKDKSADALRSTVKRLGNTSHAQHKNGYEYDAARTELAGRGEHHFAGRVDRGGLKKREVK